MEKSRKVYGWLVRDGNAAVGCSSMWADAMGGECYCGNHVGLFVFRTWENRGEARVMSVSRPPVGNPYRVRAEKSKSRRAEARPP